MESSTDLIRMLFGVFLIGYGIWFAGKGVQRCLGSEKDWWRPLNRKQRYPYPVAGTLLGICFVIMGLVFALNSVWPNSRNLGYVGGGGIFVLVIVIGVVQPRFLHPRWYGELEDRFGRKEMIRLKRAALQVDHEDWIDIVATEASFNEWVDRVMPRQMRRQSRGFKRSTDRK